MDTLVKLETLFLQHAVQSSLQRLSFKQRREIPTQCVNPVEFRSSFLSTSHHSRFKLSVSTLAATPSNVEESGEPDVENERNSTPSTGEKSGSTVRRRKKQEQSPTEANDGSPENKEAKASAKKKKKEPVVPPPPPVDPQVTIQQAAEAAGAALGGRRKLRVKTIQNLFPAAEASVASEELTQTGGSTSAAPPVPEEENSAVVELAAPPQSSGDDHSAPGSSSAVQAAQGSLPPSEGSTPVSSEEAEAAGEGEVEEPKAKKKAKKREVVEAPLMSPQKEADLRAALEAARAVVAEFGAEGAQEEELETIAGKLAGRDRRLLKNSLRVLSMVPRELAVLEVESRTIVAKKQWKKLLSAEVARQKDLNELAKEGPSWYMIQVASSAMDAAVNDIQEELQRLLPDTPPQLYVPNLKAPVHLPIPNSDPLAAAESLPDVESEEAGLLRKLRDRRGVVYIKCTLDQNLFTSICNLSKVSGFIGSTVSTGRFSNVNYPIVVTKDIAAYLEQRQVAEAQWEAHQTRQAAEAERAKEAARAQLAASRLALEKAKLAAAMAKSKAAASAKVPARKKTKDVIYRSAKVRIVKGPLAGYMADVMDITNAGRKLKLQVQMEDGTRSGADMLKSHVELMGLSQGSADDEEM